MSTAMTEILFKQPQIQKLTSREQLNKFDKWFSRCSGTLHFTARLLLGGSQMAECAVRNCRLRASRNPPSFESEGPFRSWILRLLISEALFILHQGSC
jgi:DNA-directed RNA polymerase specialized sigma24 family protein